MTRRKREKEREREKESEDAMRKGNEGTSRDALYFSRDSLVLLLLPVA